MNSNPVGNGCQHITADADDGTSVGNLMQPWVGSWRSGAVLAVILTTEEMHGDVDVAVV